MAVRLDMRYPTCWNAEVGGGWEQIKDKLQEVWWKGEKKTQKEEGLFYIKIEVP